MRLVSYASTIIYLLLFASPAHLFGASFPANPQDGATKDSPLGTIDGIGRYSLTTPVLPTEPQEEFSVDLQIDGVEYPIALSAFSMRATGFSLLIDQGTGALENTPAEPPRTYRGTANGEASEHVVASLLEDGLYATIYRNDRSGIVIQPASSLGLKAKNGVHVVYELLDLTGLPGVCGNDFYDLPSPGPTQENEPSAQGGTAGAVNYLADFAADCDYEFFQANGSSVNTTLNDVEQVMNQTDFIYSRDVNITYEITTIVIRTDSNDPYSSTSIDGRLNEYLSNWNSGAETSIESDIGQLFSGVNFSGGVIGLAPLSAVCSSQYGYSIVESRYTSNLPYRVSLTAHEMGHNWGSQHCDGSSGCAIMCSSNGGCGFPSSFGSSAQSQIVNYRDNNANCIIILADPIEPPFFDEFTSTFPSETLWIHNNGAFCSTGGLNEPSPTRSLNLDSSSSTEYGGDEIRSNKILLGGSSSAYLSFWLQQRGVDKGKQLILYYANSSNDWVELETFTSDGETQLEFEFKDYELPNSARHDGFRIRFLAVGTDSNDDWYIDDVLVSTEPVSTLPNDDCGDTSSVMANGLNSFTTIGSTNSNVADQLGCSLNSGPNVSDDVWFYYTSTCTGLLSMGMCDTVDFNARITLYNAQSGCPASNASPVACNEDSCGQAPFIGGIPTLGGTQYIIRIGSADGSQGSGQLLISCDPFGNPPPNDDCENAIAIEDGTTDFSTFLATDSSPQAPLSCSTSHGPEVEKDIWFTYTPDCLGLLSVSSCGTSFDSRVIVYSTCPDSPTSPTSGCGDDDCGDDALFDVVVLPDVPLLIRIGSPEGQEGAATLTLSCQPFEIPCPEDLSGDGNVDGADIGLLLAAWGQSGNADLNNDGNVNGADIGLLLAAWGKCD
jgi:hypothetical protein